MIDEKDEVQTEKVVVTEVSETDVPEGDESANDDVTEEADGRTVALGILAELETRLHLLHEGVIRFDDRQISWLHGKAAELRQAL